MRLSLGTRSPSGLPARSAGRSSTRARRRRFAPGQRVHLCGTTVEGSSRSADRSSRLCAVTRRIHSTRCARGVGVRLQAMEVSAAACIATPAAADSALGSLRRAASPPDQPTSNRSQKYQRRAQRNELVGTGQEGRAGCRQGGRRSSKGGSPTQEWHGAAGGAGSADAKNDFPRSHDRVFFVRHIAQADTVGPQAA